MSQAGRVIQHVGKLTASRQAKRAREDHKVRRVFNQSALGNLAQALRGIEAKQMRAAVYGVHRLAPSRFARINIHEGAV